MKGKMKLIKMALWTVEWNINVRIGGANFSEAFEGENAQVFFKLLIPSHHF